MDSKVAGQQPSQATRHKESEEKKRNASKHTGKQAKRDHEKGGNSRTVNGKETATFRCKAIKIHNQQLKEAQQKEKDLTAEVTKCHGELEAMQSANDELEKEKASLEMRVTELYAQLEARMDDLRRDKNEKFYLMKHLEEAKQTIEKGKASEEALRQMVDKLQDEKAKLEKNTSPLSMADMELAKDKEHKKALEQEQARNRKTIKEFEIKIARLQGELAENQRASEADRNELVAAKVQRQLAIKERDATAEEWRKRDQQVECQRKETDKLQKQLQDAKDENAYLHGQLAENHRVEEMKRNELETAKLEKRAVEEKYLESCNQVDNLTKELEKTQRQLKESKKEYSACLKKLQMKHNSLQDDFQLECRSLQASTDSSLVTATEISNVADVLKVLNHQLDAEWREFGTFLYVKPPIMDRISKDKSKASACMLMLVEKWLYHEDQTGDLPRTWGSVVMAVKDTGNGFLARQLAKWLEVKQ